MGAAIADTTTPNIKITNQTEGGNSNSWGTIADANFEEIDDKFGDVTSISTSGGTTTLTDSQEIVNAIVVTGTLSSNVEIEFSGRGGTWVIKNGTSGDYTVTCLVSGQSGVEIEQGAKQTVFCNGTDIEAGSGPSNATSIPSGMMAPYAGTTSPTGWVRCNGRTIGNAASSATERANADTETLFLLLWDSFANAELAIQDSAGSATSRGASAAADYAANKRMPVPDLRGRTFFGLDAMGNSAAGRLGSVLVDETTNGETGGTETVTLSEANLASHTHTGPSHTHTYAGTTSGRSATHTHTFSATTGSGGTHSHAPFGGGSFLTTAGGYTTAGSGATAVGAATATDTVSDHTHTVSGTTAAEGADHTHNFSGTTSSSGTGSTGSAGSGTAHSNMPPAFLGTWIIKL